jgi:hypothetical protein
MEENASTAWGEETAWEKEAAKNPLQTEEEMSLESEWESDPEAPNLLPISDDDDEDVVDEVTSEQGTAGEFNRRALYSFLRPYLYAV